MDRVDRGRASRLRSHHKATQEKVFAIGIFIAGSIPQAEALARKGVVNVPTGLETNVTSRNAQHGWNS